MSDPDRVWRVGYRPTPWAWTPWQYAGDDGRFPGRWDDPRGVFRTVYAGRDLFGCLLEVLARFRPDPLLVAALDEIEQDPVDDVEQTTLPPGSVPTSWLTTRAASSATLGGTYCAVTRTQSVATIRGRFIQQALALGLPDVDAGSLRLSVPRSLTQQVAGWLYDLHTGGDDLVAGIEFESRHGDGLTLWAVFERPADTEVSRHLTGITAETLDVGTPALLDAFEVHGLRWA